MKRVLFLLCTFLLFATVPSFANTTEIQLTQQSRSNTQDRVWNGSFQMAWNDLKNRFVFDDVRFAEGTPISVQDLNNSAYTPEYIPEDCYYRVVTKVTKSARRNAVKYIKKNFEESSSLLESVDLTRRNDRVLVYSMFKKSFSFANPFDELGFDKFGEGQEASYFGVSQSTKNNYRNSVDVLFYNSKYDFAIKINTTGNGVVYLYKTPSNKPFNQLFNEMMLKETTYYGDKKFSEIDELKIPSLTLNRDYLLEELCGKRVKGTNLVVDKALTSIRFHMDNTGEKIKNEEGKKIMEKALASEVAPRLFYLDDSFVLFLKAKNQHVPYFALRVNDITNYQEQLPE